MLVEEGTVDGAEDSMAVDDAALARALQDDEDRLAADHRASAAMSELLAAQLQFAEGHGDGSGLAAVVALAAEGSTLASPRPSLLEGLLEKKPVRDAAGKVARGMGGGWRTRRMILYDDGLEWHRGDEDEDEPQSLDLDPMLTTVRAAGDASDDHDRCLTLRHHGSSGGGRRA